MRNCLIILALICLCFGISLPGFAKPAARANQQTGINQAGAIQPNTDKAVEETKFDDVDYGPFMRDLQVKVKKAWHPPKADESRQALVVFRVDRDGLVSKVRVSKSSGNATADHAAIRAIESVSYQLKLPPKSPKFVDIQFTFDYNVTKPEKQKTAKRHHICNNYFFALIVAPLLIFLFVGLINVLVHLQRKRAPIWLIGSVLLGMFAAIGFLWPFLNSVK